MKKELLKIHEHPTLIAIDRKMRNLADTTSVRFLSLKNEVDAERNRIWDEAEDYLRAQNLLPEDFSRSSYVLLLEDGKVFIQEAAEAYKGLPGEAMAMIKRIIGGEDDERHPFQPGPLHGKKNGTQN